MQIRKRVLILGLSLAAVSSLAGCGLFSTPTAAEIVDQAEEIWYQCGFDWPKECEAMTKQFCKDYASYIRSKGGQVTLGDEFGYEGALAVGTVSAMCRNVSNPFG